jgi:hypothetical protein
MLALSSLGIKTLKECRPGELVVPRGHKVSALVTESKDPGGIYRGLIVLMPGRVTWEGEFLSYVVSLQSEWELQVDPWDQRSALQRTTGAIGLYGQRTLTTLAGGYCCDLSTYELLKFPDNLGSQTASFGTWEIRAKPSQSGEEKQTLYAFSCPT